MLILLLLLTLLLETLLVDVLLLCCLCAGSIGAPRQPAEGSRRRLVPFQLLPAAAAETSPARAAEACCSGQVRCAAAVAVAAEPAGPGGKLYARHVLQQVDQLLPCICIVIVPCHTVHPKLHHLLLYVRQLRDLL
jgi:hypothetical protein